MLSLYEFGDPDVDRDRVELTIDVVDKSEMNRATQRHERASKPGFRVRVRRFVWPVRVPNAIYPRPGGNAPHPHHRSPGTRAMSLTKGSGPLSGWSANANYTVDAPGHRILFEADARRLRAYVGDRVVLDTTRAHLLHETGIRPVAYAPLEDFDTSVLERSTKTTHCPFKGQASYWSIRIGDDVREDAVWAYEDPIQSASWLKGFAAVYFGKPDRWLVEDEEAVGHLRDPYHRIDVHPSSRAVRVRAGDDVIASSERPKLLFETGEPVRAYMAPGVVEPGRLEPSRTRTVCPYKGELTYWHVHAGGEVFRDGACSIELPRAEAMKIAGLVCFIADGLTVELA